jgi:hypothetical protein
LLVLGRRSTLVASMELIEALEKLSLHVKCNQRHFGLDQAHSSTSSISQKTATHEDWPSSSNISDQYQSYQLHQFEDSIETLFSQINDLDHLNNQEASNAYQKQSSEIDSFNRRNRLKRSFLGCGSLDTSQEEDSDNSSQQSINGYSKNKTTETEELSKINHSTQSLIVSLMKRDINSITDSVRRICRILALGNEIETIYKTYFMSDLAPKQHIDSSACRALCDSFMELCSCEPYVCDLPTVVRFTKNCRMLMQQLNIAAPLGSNNANAQLGDYHHDPAIGTVDCQEDELDDNRMCLDDACDALDCALLECDQEQLDNNWTNSKLYKQ